jgi:hypothetical protein
MRQCRLSVVNGIDACALAVLAGCAFEPGSGGSGGGGRLPAVAGTWEGEWDSSIYPVFGTFEAEITQTDVPFLGLSEAPLRGSVTATSMTFGDSAGTIVFEGTLDGDSRARGTYVYCPPSDRGGWSADRLGEAIPGPPRLDPVLTDPYEPDDFDAASPVVLGTEDQFHRFHTSQDTDFVILNVSAATAVAFETSQASVPADTVLRLYDATRALIQEDDDGGLGLYFRIEANLDAGTYYLDVFELAGKTGYYLLAIRLR